MRWFVEVSRLGENDETQRYCVEAKQWQVALQEARKLRGDSGSLSGCSIELMDDGYRAVDGKLKVRYLINKAPGDAPLTGSNGAAVPATSRGSLAPATERMSHPPASAPVRKLSRPRIKVPDDAVPPAPPPPGSSRPVAAHASTHPTQRSLDVAQPPPFQLVRKREEEPTRKTPITYREYAYAVDAGTSIRAVEALVWARFREVRASLDGCTSGQFVQLAVFDHVFVQRPQRPPLCTLTWKDWRGNPVVQFPGDPSAQPSAPPPGGSGATPSPSKPSPSKPSPSKPSPSKSSPSKSSPSKPSRSKPSPSKPSRSKPATPATTSRSKPSRSKPSRSKPSRSKPSPSKPSRSKPATPATTSPAPSKPATPTTASPAPSKPATPTTASPASPPSPRPVVAVQSFPAGRKSASPAKLAPAVPAVVVQEPPTRRCKTGEDLIGELFETMHDLHFMSDLVSGAEFVLGVLEKTLPSEGVLIHVFDLNTRHYVVVRASAPGAGKVIMHRVPDGDSLFEPVMRRMRSIRIDDAARDGRFKTERWTLAGVEVTSALCGPVQLAGRYLGMVELVNPEGGGTFYESESNALDYICGQFAEFLSNHPIVIDAELILAQP